MRRRTLLAAPALLLGACGRPKTPAGQPPLTRLNESNFETFRETFNRDADKIRVLLLLSPT